jgi:uncharacterized membrane protein YeaQ/YmgE (transglycosylase-associated protein family)
MGWIGWIILGGLAGFVAKLIMKEDGGLLKNIVLGVIGGLLGGGIVQLLGGTGVSGFNLYSFIVAVIGAIIVIYIARMITKDK